jgi:predicted RNA binding protein YcfA (HicA-like mRNA interferase family)
MEEASSSTRYHPNGNRSSIPKLPGVNHLDAVRALEKVGFQIVRQGRHIIMSDGERKVVILRHNPVIAITMGGIARDAGLTVDEFRTLL